MVRAFLTTQRECGTTMSNLPYSIALNIYSPPRFRKKNRSCRYHSHPFELSQHSHCFLSQTDLSTQLQWQRAEDGHGNPFVAIVVDPLRTRHLQEPVLKAFRAYPPEHAPASPNECPNGAIETSEQVRLERWGSCWNRYYELRVDYRMTPACRKILEQLTSDSIWIRNLSSSQQASQASNPAAEAARLRGLADQCRTAHAALGASFAAAAAAAAARGLPSQAGSAAATAAAGAPSRAALPAPSAILSTSAPLQLQSQPATASSVHGGSSSFARSEEAMAALTVAAPSSSSSSSTQPNQAGSSSGTNSGAAQWAAAVRAVVDAAEDVIVNEHRNAAKGRVFG
jgi:hypothetical protein